MKEDFKPIETAVGIIVGRDGIFLDKILFDYSKNSVKFQGEINSVLCSGLIESEAFIPYTLEFIGVLAFTIIELDFAARYGNSCFDLVLNSEWLRKMLEKDHSNKISANHNHYLFATYDDIIEVVCHSYNFKIEGCD